MYYQRLSDEEIMSGFRDGDADIIREYFYGYCRVGYMAEAGVCESTDFFGEDIMDNRKHTPELITELKPNEIFVFGSNLKGMHGGGAAYVAYRKFGAVMGQGVGLQGQSYAIPTMQGGVDTIKPYVDEFIRFAKEHPELTFLVTKIGCGIAGFTEKEIAPLFYHAIDCENVVLPKEFDDIVQEMRAQMSPRRKGL